MKPFPAYWLGVSFGIALASHWPKVADVVALVIGLAILVYGILWVVRFARTHRVQIVKVDA